MEIGEQSCLRLRLLCALLCLVYCLMSQKRAVFSGNTLLSGPIPSAMWVSRAFCLKKADLRPRVQWSRKVTWCLAIRCFLQECLGLQETFDLQFYCRRFLRGFQQYSYGR